jgi:hypothetical protein
VEVLGEVEAFALFMETLGYMPDIIEWYLDVAAISDVGDTEE